MSCVVFNPPVSNYDLQIAIDFSSFEVKAGNGFGGIKNLPEGIHVISFTSQTGANSSESIRYGYWFEVGTHSNNYYAQYDETEQIYKLMQEPDCEKYVEISHRFHSLMVNYPQIEEIDHTWLEFTEYVRMDQVSKILGSHPGYADSSMTTLEEIRWLNEKLKQGQKNDTPFFKYTTVKFKSRDAIRDDRKMEDFLDKSYYLNEKIVKREYQGHINRLLGELQMAFLNVILFGNYGSSLQWHNLIELVCFSSEVDRKTIERLDKCVAQQLHKLPEEYHTLINEDVWQRCLVKSFQSGSLTRTREAMQEVLPSIDSGFPSDEDDDKPTIAGGVYYQRR